MKRSDEKRLADLRAQNELAELEILTLRADELTSSVDPEELTIGQMIVVGELFNVLSTLSDFKRTQAADRLRDILGSTSGNVERRSDRPTYASDVAGFPEPESDDFDTDDSDTDDSDESMSPESQAAFLSLLQALASSGGESSEIGDDDMVDTVQGPMRYGDLPKDDNGIVTQEFADANCTCPAHVAKREAARNDPEDFYPTSSDGSPDEVNRPYGQYV